MNATLGTRDRRRTAAATLVAAAALTLLAAWPVVTHPLQRIAGAEIVGRHHDPFTVMQQFAGYAVAGPYLQPATDWVGRALAWVMPPVAAYNSVILWTFPLAALFAALFALEVTGSVAGSVLAGVLFAFAPFHAAQAAYHPHIAQVQWMALYFLALWRSLHGATIARAAALALATALVSLSNDYGGFIAMTLTPVALVAFWFAPGADGRPRSLRDLAMTTATLLVLAAAGLAAVTRLAPGLLANPSLFAVSRLDVFRYSAQWRSYLLPPAAHPLLGAWSRQVLESHGVGPGLLEQQVTAGLGVLVLALAGLWLGWRHRDGPARGALVALAVVASFGVACSLSPEWRIGGLTVPRPSALLYHFAPMFRAYARFAVVVQLMLSVLAGWGAVALWRRRSIGARAGLMLIAAAVAFEYAPVDAASRDVMPTDAHRWLAEHESPQSPQSTTRVLECRPWTLPDSANAWLLHADVMFLGAREDCAAPDLAARLAAQGVSHLIVRADRKEMAWLTSRRVTGLSARATFPGSAVFAVAPGTSGPYVASIDGFDIREFDARHSWRWMADEARWTVVNPLATAVSVTLVIDLQAFAAERTLQLTLNGDPQPAIRVGVAETPFNIGPLQFRPGPNVLSWSTDPSPDVADNVLHNGDRRRLAIAAGEWQWAALRVP